MHVSDKRRMPFAKANKHPSFAAYIFHSEARTTTVVPAVADHQRLQPLTGTDLADTLQAILEGRLLQLPLFGDE